MPYLSEGRTPPSVDVGDGCTLADLCNAFLTSKTRKVEAGELAERSLRDYHTSCKGLVDHFGKERHVADLRPTDFERLRSSMAKRLGVVTLKNEINRCRVVFKYAHDQQLIEQPVRFGQSFARPLARAICKTRNEAGPKMFEAAELRQILDAASDQMKVMVLLGMNCGFGNTDVATLPIDAVDLDNGWIDFPRSKTEIRRRVPLWTVTVEAMRTVIANRSQRATGFIFLTAYEKQWGRVQPQKANPDRVTALDAMSPQFAKLLRKLNINGRRGLGFYSLRHTFETIGGESKDQVAVNAIMGHVDSSMAAVYTERISDERLRDVVQVVQNWLFP